MDQQPKSPFVFTREEVDVKFKAFAIRCFEIQLSKMYLGIDANKLKDVATVAEQAMTETPVIHMHHGLRAQVLAIAGNDQQITELTMQTLTSLSATIMGALVHKGPEIMEDTYTAEIFFESTNPHDTQTETTSE